MYAVLVMFLSFVLPTICHTSGFACSTRSGQYQLSIDVDGISTIRDLKLEIRYVLSIDPFTEIKSISFGDKAIVSHHHDKTLLSELDITGNIQISVYLSHPNNFDSNRNTDAKSNTSKQTTASITTATNVVQKQELSALAHSKELLEEVQLFRASIQSDVERARKILSANNRTILEYPM